MADLNKLSAPRVYIYRYENNELVTMNDRVDKVTFEDNLKKVDRATIDLHNNDLQVFDDEAWATGSQIYLSYGIYGKMSVPVQLKIKKVSGGKKLTIEAVNAAAFKLDLKKKSKTWEHKSYSQVVREVSSDNGLLNPVVQDTEEVHETVTQGNTSDAVFLRDLADREGFDFRVVAGSIHWGERDLSPAPVKEFSYGSTETQDAAILDFGINNDITRRPGRVKSAKRDVVNRKTDEASADNLSDKDRDVLSQYSLRADDETGAWSINKEPEDNDPSMGNITVSGAKKSAKGAFRTAARGTVKLWFTAAGDADLHAGDIIKLSGLGKKISGKYLVKAVKHDLQNRGSYIMNVTVTSDGVNSRKKGKGGSIGELISRLQACWRRFMQRNRGAVETYLSDFMSLTRQLDAEISALTVGNYTTTDGAGISERLGVLSDYLVRFADAAAESSALVNSVLELSVIARECYAVAEELKNAPVSAGVEKNAGKLNDKELSEEQKALVYDDESGEASLVDDPAVALEKQEHANDITVVGGTVNGKPMPKDLLDELEGVEEL